MNTTSNTTWLAVRTAVVATLLCAAANAQLLRRIDPPDNVDQQGFGHALDHANGWLLVGSPDRSLSPNAGTGVVYAYERVGNDFVLRQELRPGSPDDARNFGEDVVMEGDQVIIGSPFSIESGPSSGSAYVFERSGTTWVQTAKILPDDTQMGHEFGSHVAIVGDFAIATAGQGSGVFNPHVYFFERNGTAWSQTQTVPGGTFFDVDLEGNRAVLFDETALLFYTESGGTWMASPSFSVVPFGTPPRTLEMRGDLLVYQVAERRLHLFEHNGTQFQSDELLFTDVLSGDEVSRVGDRIAVSGKQGVFILDRVNGAWGITSRPTVHPFAHDEDGFADELTLLGDTVIVGASTRTLGNGLPGVVFELDATPPAHEAFCFGDVTSGSCTPCPCGNSSLPLERAGCTYEDDVPLYLRAHGDASAMDDTLHFDLFGGRPNSFALLFSGTDRLPLATACPPGSGIAAPVFNGLRCAGQGLLRHGTRATTDVGEIVSPWGGIGLPTAGLIAFNGFQPGDVRHFQAIVRSGPFDACTQDLDTSNGITVTIVP